LQRSRHVAGPVANMAPMKLNRLTRRSSWRGSRQTRGDRPAGRRRMGWRVIEISVVGVLKVLWCLWMGWFVVVIRGDLVLLHRELRMRGDRDPPTSEGRRRLSPGSHFGRVPLDTSLERRKNWHELPLGGENPPPCLGTKGATGKRRPFLAAALECRSAGGARTRGLCASLPSQ
jgi:hypothetical protein